MTKRDVIYAKYEAFEEELAHCYFKLHEHFIANPPLARFWAEAAMDEVQHSSILRFCRERGVMVDAGLDLKTAEHVEDLIDTVKGIVNDPDVSVDEAFYAALMVETSELEEIYDRLTSALAANHPLLHQAIHATLRSHHQSFIEGAEQFCGDRAFVEAFRNMGGISS